MSDSGYSVGDKLGRGPSTGTEIKIIDMTGASMKAVERSETEIKTFEKAGGAKRSKAMPDWAMYPRQALRLILSRFTIGRKYGYCNWKKTLDVGHDLDKDAARR